MSTGTVDLVRGWRTINCGWCGANGEIMGEENHLKLQLLADRARLAAVRELGELGRGDYDRSMASAEVLAVILGYGICRDLEEQRLIGQNAFVMTRSYAGPTLRAVLALRGFFRDEPELETVPLPDFTARCQQGLVPGVDAAADTLAHGMSVALGMALSVRVDRIDHDVYALLGNGPLEDARESLELAVRAKADRLVAFVEDRTPLGRRDDLTSAGRLFHDCGWSVHEVDGHSVKEIRAAIYDCRMITGKPHAVILHTVGGRGCTFAEEAADCTDLRPTHTMIGSACQTLQERIEFNASELEDVVSGVRSCR